MTKCDVAIIGAGPYGLAATAHLRTVKGLDVHTFGEPMDFWKQNMPVGMLLRSGWAASHIADPGRSLTLDAYREASGEHFSTPVPLNHFVDYGLWYQRRVVPDLDRRKVVRVEPGNNEFQIHLSSGESMRSRRVVVAAGIGSFTYRPPQFASIPKSLASHTSEHKNFEQFRGRRVLVVGGGQSALESAALLYESGAEVEVVTRAKQIRWLGGKVSRTIQFGLGPTLSKLLYAPTDVGPAGISQIVARPDLTRRFSRPIQDWLRKRSIRPAGARWLVARLQDVPMTMGQSVVSAYTDGSRVGVTLDNGSRRSIDHVFLGTGYRVDVTKYDFLAPAVAQSIRCFGGYPRLGEGFETSVPGLHIIGAPAVWSFGALMQFVVGTQFAGRTLFKTIAGKATRDTAQACESLVTQAG